MVVDEAESVRSIDSRATSSAYQDRISIRSGDTLHTIGRHDSINFFVISCSGVHTNTRKESSLDSFKLSNLFSKEGSERYPTLVRFSPATDAWVRVLWDNHY